MFATELPEIVPSSALVTTATFAGPPEARPATAFAEINEELSDPCLFQKSSEKNEEEDKRRRNTQSGIPRMPSVVKYM